MVVKRDFRYDDRDRDGDRDRDRVYLFRFVGVKDRGALLLYADFFNYCHL